MKILKSTHRENMEFYDWYRYQSEFSIRANFNLKEGFNKTLSIFCNYYID